MSASLRAASTGSMYSPLSSSKVREKMARNARFILPIFKTEAKRALASEADGRRRSSLSPLHSVIPSWIRCSRSFRARLRITAGGFPL